MLTFNKKTLTYDPQRRQTPTPSGLGCCSVGVDLLFIVGPELSLRFLKTGVQDSHLAKSRSPTGKSGSPSPKKLESHQFVHAIYLSILAASDTFE